MALDMREGRERMKADIGLLKRELPCCHWTPELSEGESPATLDLRGREREPLKGGTATGGRGRPSSLGRVRTSVEGERGHTRRHTQWKGRHAAFF